MENRGQFTFYRSYYDAVKALPEQMRLRVLMGLIGYGLDGVEPEGLSDIEKAIFLLVRPTLDSGRKKAAAGMAGAKVTNQQKRSKKEKEGEKEKEIEIEKETEIENKTETEDEGLCGGCGFDIFWEKFPVKIDRDGARKAYLACDQAPERLLESLEQWLRSRQWQAEGGRYIPRAAKWLREKHYLQEPVQAVPVGVRGELGQAEIEAIQRMMEE